MKKFLTLLLIAAAALSLCLASAAGDELRDFAVARVQFNLRAEPSTDSEIVANIPIGRELFVTGYTDDGWCTITYGGKSGYAKQKWLRFRTNNANRPAVPDEPDSTPTPPSKIPTPAGPTVTPHPIEDATGRGTTSPNEMVKKTDIPEDTVWIEMSEKPTAHNPPKCGISIGESDTDEIRYTCSTLATFNIRETPDDSGRKLYQIKKGKDLRVLAYGDDWCKVQTLNGKVTGYAKTQWLFHYHSLDRFKWELPWWDYYKPTGYVEMTEYLHITDRQNLYKGNKLNVGDFITVQTTEDGGVRTVLRRDWVVLNEGTYTYHPFVNWREAKAGDIIGGFTQFVGQRQGGFYYTNRHSNIRLAMSRMNNTIIYSGEEYRFYENIGPVTAYGGYKTAGVTGGEGLGIGGGVCHTSSLMYEAALTLPFYISEREPHTDEGIHYVILEFDATVGAYSDFRFYNTLPYDIKMHAMLDRAGGVMTVLFECLDTVDPEILATWDGSELNIPVS